MITKQIAAGLKIGDILRYKSDIVDLTATVRGLVQVSNNSSWFSIPIKRDCSYNDNLCEINTVDNHLWEVEGEVHYKKVTRSRS